MEQSEIDALLAGGTDAESAESEPAESMEEIEEIGWDDVQEELAAGKHPAVKRETGSEEIEEIGSGDDQEELAAVKHPAVKREIRNVEFEELKKNGNGADALDLAFILDIPLTVTVELGRGRMQVGELLQLGQGSVVELSKVAGEPMEVFANSQLIAKGEVVVVNEKFGVRLTDIVSPEERLNRLK